MSQTGAIEFKDDRKAGRLLAVEGVRWSGSSRTS